MSAERVERKDGIVVRWRQGGRNRSKVLGRKRDAEAFDAELTRRKRTGELAQLDAGKESLSAFGEEWWRLYAEPNLARSTLQVYAVQWDAHVLPRLGSIPLRELTTDIVNRFRLELEADGVGPASIRKSLTLLQGVLQRACEWSRIPPNPVAAVRKPPAGRSRAVTPLAPETVEASIGSGSWRGLCRPSRTDARGSIRRSSLLNRGFPLGAAQLVDAGLPPCNTGRVLLQKRIHEWSKTLPAWQRDLLRRLAAGPLTPEQQIEVLAILADDDGAPAPVALGLGDLPADEDEHGPVELTEISDLENINLLAAGQTLRFAPGLNVVFGLTGAGKSGYSRLLRRLCRAAHRGEVLRNAFDPGVAAAPQTARLGITVDGDARDVPIDLAHDPERLLSQMAVFDTHCAGVLLSGPNVIEHAPRPMLLLKLLVETQDALAAKLTQRGEELRASLPALPDIPSATEAGRRLATLTAAADPADIERFAALTPEEHEELKQLDVAAATIASDQSRQIEAAARSRARATQHAVDALGDARARLDDAAVRGIGEARSALDDSTTAERELVDKAFSGQRFAQTGQRPWQEMWEAARRFVEAGGGSFPDTGPDAACPTCQQELDDDARKRMRTFEEFVRSDLSTRVAGLRADLASKASTIPDVASVRARVDEALDGAPDQVVAVATRALDVLAAREQIARGIAEGKDAATPDPLVDTVSLVDHVTEQTALADAQAGLRDEDEQRRITSRRAELLARTALAAELPAVRTHITTLKQVARLDDAKRKLGSTRKISHQLRELQQAVITDRLRKAVEVELDGLHPIAGRVEVVGSASKGETVIRLRLMEPCRENVGDVLSEGEQRALALAFFLADVAVSEGRSAIILDDPVSSLDHERRAYVARRLVAEAERRQVIVFTHDFTFVYLLQEAAEQAGRELVGQTLERANHQIGIASDELPTKAMSPSKRRKNLRHRLKTELTPLHNRQGQSYEREADIWTTDLRKAYDQLIEDYVLAGTVRRWHAQVRVRQLRQIKWSMEIVERIEAGMKKAANKTHHEATELQPAPFTPDGLSAMLDDFDALCALTHPEKKDEDDAASKGSTALSAISNGVQEDGSDTALVEAS